MKVKTKNLTKLAEGLSPSNTIVLNCRGIDVTTSLQTVKKIRGSVLEQMFSNKLSLAYVDSDKPFLDCDSVVFSHVLTYL